MREQTMARIVAPRNCILILVGYPFRDNPPFRYIPLKSGFPQSGRLRLSRAAIHQYNLPEMSPFPRPFRIP